MTKSSRMWNQKRRGLRITRLMARDGADCIICGQPLDRSIPMGDRAGVATDPMAVSFDHIIPRADGGGDEIDNLRLAHRHCNIERGRDPLDEGTP